jgi:hypothetical protein
MEIVMTRHTRSVIAFSSSAAAATLAAILMAGSALAETPTIDNTQFVSTKTRAEVQAELFSHRDQLSSSANEWVSQQNEAQNANGYTRQQARAEYIASRDQIRAMNSEDGGSRSLAQTSVQTTARSL